MTPAPRVDGPEPSRPVDGTGRQVRRFLSGLARRTSRRRQIDLLQRRVARLETRSKELTRLRWAMAPTPAAGPGRPSWQAFVRTNRRLYWQVSQLPDRDAVPHWRLPHKLESYRLAQSHGVRIPTLYAGWERLQDIDLSVLPETFVLKSDGGSTSRGVFPVRRTGDGYTQVDGSREFGPTGIQEELAVLEASGRGRPPYFAEQLLRDEAGSALPHDVKVFCFYGEVGQVLVRDVPVHGEDATLRKRYLRPDGTDLTEEIPEQQDPTLPLPPHFDDLVRTAATLSLALPLPFVRVDLYDSTDGITFGEFTLVPGGRHDWRLDHDTHLGTMAEAAQARLWRDLAAGRPFDFVRGEHPSALTFVVSGDDDLRPD